MPAKKRFSYACSPQLPEATIRCASAASGPYSYAGLNQRQSESASIEGWLIEKAFAGYSPAAASGTGLHRPDIFILRCGPKDHELLVSQSYQGIDSRCPPRRQKSSRKPGGRKRQQRGADGERIGALHSEEHRRN